MEIPHKMLLHIMPSDNKMPPIKCHGTNFHARKMPPLQEKCRELYVTTVNLMKIGHQLSTECFTSLLWTPPLLPPRLTGYFTHSRNDILSVKNCCDIHTRIKCLFTCIANGTVCNVSCMHGCFIAHYRQFNTIQFGLKGLGCHCCLHRQ